MFDSVTNACLVLHDSLQIDWIGELSRYTRLPWYYPENVPNDAGLEFELRLEPEGLGLYRLQDSRQQPVRSDLGRWLNRVSRKDLLCRAIGKSTVSVVDATAGLGSDSAQLAACGYSVQSLERHPVMVALLLDGRKRAPLVIQDRLSIMLADSCLTLKCFKADVIYLDPMFPLQGKRSLPRQAMQVARQLVGDDSDVHGLFESAMAQFHRVVVKRPDKAAPLDDRMHHRVVGKTVAFDVYINTDIPT